MAMRQLLNTELFVLNWKKKGTPIGPLDTLIASHAKSLDVILVTNNVREFDRIPGLKIENWVK
jgi:tRNA(fMet)-specific endonuclease VapC